MNYIDKIEEAIREAAEMKPAYTIQTAESILPLMEMDGYSEVELDVPYADLTKAEKMDLFYPQDNSQKHPVFIEVHGGGWYFGQKRSVEFQPFLAGLKRGFVCVSLGYTLSPAAHYPLPVLEVKSAIRFLRKNAAKYRIDPDRIILWGGSAGAHLAALATTSCDTGYLTYDLNDNAKYSAKPAVLALWYGCYELEKMKDVWMVKNFTGIEDLTSAKEDMRLCNPISHITKDICPTFLQHGTADSIVDCSHSVRFYNRIKEVTDRKETVLELLEGYSHADMRMFSEENVNRIFDFAQEHFPVS